ncbi:ParB/RepB/Spo0J family partition protein [Streptomyces chartreusis]|uniref:ParB/RepB/Spo0J family partition protein n=1 Tax=Streptomyces chartreusis TaxID=1969 RepID=UPI00382BDA9E
MEIATCTYQEFTPDMGVPVRTTVGRPRFRLGYELTAHARTLTPTRDLLKIEDEAAYEAGYRALLGTRGADAIRTELEGIAAQHGNGRLVLLCFDRLDKPNSWCHRTHAARWLGEHLDLDAPELGARRAPVPAQRPAPAKKATAPAAPPGHPRTVQKRVPIDRIDRDPSQPRKVFDQAKLEELAGSMRELGQLQPISLRYVPASRRYVIVLGERRWRAAQMAGLTELDAVVVHGLAGDDRETLARQVAENVGRADMTPMEEAESFKRLTDAEFTVDEVAKRVGKSASYVGWRIDLMRLCEPAREALSKGHLTVGLAWYVSLLNPGNQARFLTRHARGEFKSVRAAEAFARAARTEEQRQEQQGSFFVLAEETPAREDGQGTIPLALDLPEGERERITTERGKLTGRIDRLSTAGDLLADLASMDAADLALLLDGTPGGVAGHAQRLEHLRDVLMRAHKNLRKAQAIASVRASGLTVNPDAATFPAAS